MTGPLDRRGACSGLNRLIGELDAELPDGLETPVRARSLLFDVFLALGVDQRAIPAVLAPRVERIAVSPQPGRRCSIVGRRRGATKR